MEDSKEISENNTASQDIAEIINSETQSVTSSLASKYYDLALLKSDVLADVGSYGLKDIEFEPGRYEIAVDFVGTLETAIRTFGLAEMGIEETESGYKLGEQEAGSIDLLDGAEMALAEYADKVAENITESLNLPGVFYYGFSSEWADNALRLFYVFEEQDLYELQKLGANIKGFEEMAEASFAHIMAALEEEGCHDLAKKLHSILWEH